jgi:hypothetical protein
MWHADAASAVQFDKRAKAATDFKEEGKQDTANLSSLSFELGPAFLEGNDNNNSNLTMASSEDAKGLAMALE